MGETSSEVPGLDVTISGPRDSNGNFKVVVTLEGPVLDYVPGEIWLTRPCPLCGKAALAAPYPDDEQPGLDIDVQGPADAAGMITVKVTLDLEIAEAIPGSYGLARPCPLCGIGNPPPPE